MLHPVGLTKVDLLVASARTHRICAFTILQIMYKLYIAHLLHCVMTTLGVFVNSLCQLPWVLCITSNTSLIDCILLTPIITLISLVSRSTSGLLKCFSQIHLVRWCCHGHHLPQGITDSSLKITPNVGWY